MLVRWQGVDSIRAYKELDHSAGRGREKPMFKIPAYDPLAIAVLGFGVLLAAAFAYRL